MIQIFIFLVIYKFINETEESGIGVINDTVSISVDNIRY